MKLKFLIFETKAPTWVEAARTEYAGKIRPFADFELQTLKSPSAGREDAEVKRRREGELLLKQIDPKDLLILFDEKGEAPPSSEAFAKRLGRVLEAGKPRLVFCIGGPYGFTDEIKTRAGARWSLSALTMNHWIAQLAALEQIYRGFTILRGIPYHNR
jgi:23S rRNA (pseudouridine1915-N3)-methyltransferase